MEGSVFAGGDMLDDDEGVGRITKTGREEFEPKRVVFFALEGMVNRRFGKGDCDVPWVVQRREDRFW